MVRKLATSPPTDPKLFKYFPVKTAGSVFPVLKQRLKKASKTHKKLLLKKKNNQDFFS